MSGIDFTPATGFLDVDIDASSIDGDKLSPSVDSRPVDTREPAKLMLALGIGVVALLLLAQSQSGGRRRR